MPIVQLMPPPQKVTISFAIEHFYKNIAHLTVNVFVLQTLNEKRTRLEKYLNHLMEKQRTLNEGVQPLDLSYLLTGRGARRRTTATNVPHLNN